MPCDACSNWRCEELTWEELLKAWGATIDGKITPGHLRRYEKEAQIRGTSVEQVRIGYKYCTAGMLKRFYLRKGGNDHKAAVPMKKCPKLTTGDPVEIGGNLWSACTTETHGPSEVRGINFTSGLYENNTYIRIPLYGSVRPKVQNVSAECSVCGQRAERTIALKLEKSFCCNKHYLEWWAKRYREEFKRLLK